MRNRVSIVFMSLGALLIAASISLAVYNLCQERGAADAADSVMPLLVGAIEANANDGDKKPESDTPETVETPPYENPDESRPQDGSDAAPTTAGTESDKMTVVEINGYGYIGYLSIPALGLELPVMSKWDYSRLKKSPCLYYGSVKTDNMVIAAHNYARHFGKLSKLKIGDTVRFTDMDGNVYVYAVGDLEIIKPTATEEMIASDWELSLYTCTYGGKSRVTVRCERVIE